MRAHHRQSSRERRKVVIGLIGGMGSGKSRVAAELLRLGARVISGDELGHEALQQPDTINQVVQRVGTEVLDDHGRIDRRVLGKIVFADAAQLQALEKLVFPYIQRRIREQIGQFESSLEGRWAVLDAAVMLEAGWDDACDVIVFVHAPRAVRRQRLAEQRGWTAEEVEARERAQFPLAEKISRADYVLDNSGTSEETVQQIDDLLRQLL
jgi:dephospho-CoA kinase